MHFVLILGGFHRLLGNPKRGCHFALCLFRRPLTDEEKPVQIVFLWTRVYVLFSVNQIIGRELVPFEKWYQEAKPQIKQTSYGIKQKFKKPGSVLFLDGIFPSVFR